MNEGFVWSQGCTTPDAWCGTPELLVSESEYGYRPEVLPAFHDDCHVAGGFTASMYASSVLTAGSQSLAAWRLGGLAVATFRSIWLLLGVAGEYLQCSI